MYTKWARLRPWGPGRSAFRVRPARFHPASGTSARQRPLEPSSQPGESAERTVPERSRSEKSTSKAIFWAAKTHPLVERDRAERVEPLTFEANGSGVADKSEPAVATTAESPVREAPISEGPGGSVARGVNDAIAGAGGGAFCFRKTNDPILLPGGSVARGENHPIAGTGGGAVCFRKTNDPIWLGAAAETIRRPAAQSGESAERPFPRRSEPKNFTNEAIFWSAKNFPGGGARLRPTGRKVDSRTHWGRFDRRARAGGRTRPSRWKRLQPGAYPAAKSSL